MSEKSSSNSISVHIILHHHFRGGGVQSHDDVDDAGGGVQNWPKVDGVICARSPIPLLMIMNKKLSDHRIDER